MKTKKRATREEIRQLAFDIYNFPGNWREWSWSMRKQFCNPTAQRLLDRPKRLERLAQEYYDDCMEGIDEGYRVATPEEERAARRAIAAQQAGAPVCP